MKKIFVILFLLLFANNVLPSFAIENIVSLEEEGQNVETSQSEQLSQPLEASISFDWLDVSLAQREEYISKYKNLLFENNSSKIYLNKEEFKTKFAKYKKDKEFKLHYMLTNEGVTEDEDAKYCAFFYKRNTLVMYAIQYKNNPTNSFYYSAFGKLYYADVISEEYPNFPYTSMQYDKKGNLKSAIYFLSKDMQYMFGPDKEFQGVWYKDKMYDKNGKSVLTRSQW